MTTAQDHGSATEDRGIDTPGTVEVDNLRSLHPSALREQIPATGLREYWYPAILDRKVPNAKPVKVKILGTELALFRDEDGLAAAVADACPHRGASLSRGDCHFAGTITCPYHGWTFNATGEVAAVLGEGPESRVPGMPEARVRTYPTQTHAGIVFVWMGDGEPVDIREDVPPQLFDDSVLVQHSVTTWNCNWRPAFENLLDAHVFYVHRNSLHILLMPVKNMLVMSKMGPRRPRPRVVNGRGLVYKPGDLAFLSAFVGGDSETPTDRPAPKVEGRRWPASELQEAYPGLKGAMWPKKARRVHLSKVVGMVAAARKRTAPGPMVNDLEWHDAHLPATYQVDYQHHLYSRITVPIDEETSRIFYLHTTRRGGRLKELRDRAYFTLYQNWMMNYNFSGQDADVVEYQHYDQPENFSATDTFPLTLRRFILENGRDFVRARTQEGR